jgi:hypothetical protein
MVEEVLNQVFPIYSIHKLIRRSAGLGAFSQTCGCFAVFLKAAGLEKRQPCATGLL